MSAPWMSSIFNDPIDLRETISVIGEQQQISPSRDAHRDEILTWQCDGFSITRYIREHPVWPCPFIELRLQNLGPNHGVVELQWTLSHQSNLICLHNGLSSSSTPEFGAGATVFPLFFHRIHRSRAEAVDLRFRVRLDAEQEAAISVPIWFIRSKYETLFSGIAFLVRPDDIVASASALCCRADVDSGSKLMQVLSRKFSPIFWVNDTIPDDVMSVLCTAPIRVVISLAGLSEDTLESTRRRGLVVHEIDPNSRFLPRVIQDAVDGLVGISRRHQVVVVAPRVPEFMVCSAVTAAAHGYQLLFDEDGVAEEIVRLTPTQVAVSSERRAPLLPLVQQIEESGIPCQHFAEDPLSVCEGTANAMTTFGSVANIEVDSLLNPDSTDQERLDRVLAADEAEKASESVYWAAEPMVNAPPLFVVATYSRNVMHAAMSAGNYAKSKNATFYLIPDFSESTKEHVWSLLKDLGRFLDEGPAQTWHEIHRALCIQALTGETPRRLATYTEDAVQTTTFPFLERDEAEKWLRTHSAEDLAVIADDCVDAQELDRTLAGMIARYSAHIPSSIAEDIPHGSLIPFDSVFTALLGRIGRALLRDVPETIRTSLFFTARKAILYFPADPGVPFELMGVPEVLLQTNTMHTSSPFGRIVSSAENDAPLQCSYAILHAVTGVARTEMVVVADPTCDLGASRAEATALGEGTTFRPRCLVGQEATRDNVVKAISDATLVYFSCHGGWDSTGHSYLRLHDGELNGAALPRLYGQPLVIANACLSGVDVGYLSMGSLALDFIKHGAIAFIGTLWRVDSLRAAITGAHLLDGILEKPVGTALAGVRRPGLLPSFTSMAYVLYGDPTLSVYEPMAFSAEAYYYSRCCEHFYQHGMYDLAAKLGRKATVCFHAMEAEFEWRAQRDLPSKATWFGAAQVASHIQRQLTVDCHLARANSADNPKTVETEWCCALSLLREGRRLAPENAWYDARLNGLLGQRQLSQACRLIENGMSNADRACSKLRLAVQRFSRALEKEPGESNRAAFSGHLAEARGLLLVCQFLASRQRTEDDYSSLLEALQCFHDGSLTAIEPEEKRRLAGMQELPLSFLIEWDQDMLEQLDLELASGRMGRTEFDEAREHISTRVGEYRELRREINNVTETPDETNSQSSD